MSMFHLGWFLAPGITVQGWNDPNFAPSYDWTKPISSRTSPGPGARLLRPPHSRRHQRRSLRLSRQHGFLSPHGDDDAEARIQRC